MEPAGRPWDPTSPPAIVSTVDLHVSKRLLWIGDAAYPLQNIARVYTFIPKPRRAEALLRCFRRTAATVSVAVVLRFFGKIWSSVNGGSGNDGLNSFITFAGAVAVFYFISELIPVLTAQPQFVLAVETSGPSIAVVTSSDPNRLRQIAYQIASAIEDPGASFHVRVDRISLSPRHYHFGDSVNMYGGSGNVGVAKG
jgi:hypothetical protein